ncbi:hypothetical protein [Mycobacterium sp. NPDC050853]|uniref:hypothetical protein n=1 Tax=Mycobacterium sp. NPDC050853 TaxID=3155160 RepID=UPI00340B90F0
MALGEPIDILGAIDRGAVLGILGAADKVLATKQLAQRQAQALRAVREIHTPCECPPRRCNACNDFAPCATVRAIDEAGV